MGVEEAKVLRNLLEADEQQLMQWHEAGHHRPAFEYRVLDNGDGQGVAHPVARSIVGPFVHERLLPYVRGHFGRDDLEVACCILRRASPEQELRTPVPQDGAAYATAVLGLSSTEDYNGGLFIEDFRHDDTRHFVPLGLGDVVVYRHDTAQGVRVSEGHWWSLVFWLRGGDVCVAPWLEEEAAGGDADAQALLGAQLLEGRFGYRQDQARAHDLLARAAELGHRGAQSMLGTMYLEGAGVPKCPDTALAWWRKAARAGHAESRRGLGELLLERGGRSRLEEALAELRAAAAQGDCAAMYRLFQLYSEGTPGLAPDLQAARSYLMQAANGGHAEGQCSLGLAHIGGTLVDRSIQDALRWLISAAHGGALEAQQFLASFFRAAPDTRDQAWHWLLQAAKKGDVGSQRDLGALALEASVGHAGHQAEALQAIGRAWLHLADARGGRGGSAASAPSPGGGHGDVARCLSALPGRVEGWPLQDGHASFLQSMLEDFSDQATQLMKPGASARISPSFHLCMHLMSVHHNSDCLFRWSNSKGIRDLPRAATHDDSGVLSVDKSAVVVCSGWDSASPSQRRRIADEAFAKLTSQGYVVLEKLLPLELVTPLEAEFEQLLRGPEIMSTETLRAGRTQTALPFQLPWNDDQLVGHDLVMELVVRYICNNDAMACTTNEEQAWAFMRWVADGADVAHYVHGPESAKASPSFGAIDVIRTPPQTLPQLRHRDTNLPGVCSSLTVNVPLTPLTPQNGPIGFVPESHFLRNSGQEVIACAPPGSVIIYDSFTEHRGCENTTSRPRSVLSMTFDPGVWMRSFNPATGGPDAWDHHTAFQRKIDERLRKVQAAVRAGAPWPASESQGFADLGACDAGAGCCGRRSGRSQEPQLLAPDPASGQRYCKACWDRRLYWRDSSGGPESQPRPYLGLAGW